jgi:putative transcriptional regulator
MIRHHPSEATLIAQAAGHLPALHARVLAVHLSACPHCRGELHRLEEVGGELLAALPPAPLQPDALARTLARLDDSVVAPPPAAASAVASAAGPAAAPTAVAAPATARTAATAPATARTGAGTPAPVTLDALAVGRWWWLGHGIRLMPLSRRDASGTRLDLIRVAPGVAMPGHGHTGSEMACILQGAYADETGEYSAYDIAEGDAALDHTPVASPGADCICLIATTGRLRGHTWLARLVQPLIGV